jgi:hypothetical protein
MTNHTPAPWHIEFAMAQGGEAHHVCDSRDMSELSIIATVHFHDDEDGETKANARLISAAPELLNVLKDIAEYGLSTRNIKEAKSIIAKVTGE